jgi:hypothetical protein
VSVEFSVTITDTSGELRVSVEASIIDLSLTGFRAGGIPRRFAQDQVVELRFEPPGAPRPVVTEGRVMWSRDDQVGIRFLQLAPPDHRLLAEFLAGREVPRPV